MASLRRKFTISWNDGDPIEVTTSARDIVESGELVGDNPVAATFGLLYSALKRQGHEVPPYDEWLDLIDEIDQVGTVVEGIPGPTSPAPLAGEPLPSLV